MVTKREKTVFIIFVFILLSLTVLPLFLATEAGGDTHVFGGFFFNPLDSNSYIAKMRQGYDGQWSFKLSYTFERGEAAYIQVFYIFLGHLSRILKIPLIFAFHFFRIIFSVLMYWMLFQFTAKIFENKSWRWIAFTLAAVGSGLGWFALFFNQFTADMWVAETYPFLSANTNPHFPAALALQLWFFMPRKVENIKWGVGLQTAIASLLLAITSPFGMVIVGVVLGANFLWRWFNKLDWKPVFYRLMIMAFFAGPILIYYQTLSANHPVLSQWSIQNQTLTPPLWDILISFSPALILAIAALPTAWKSKRNELHLLMLWWIACMILIFLPFSLQRRMMQGLYIPTALLAVLALEKMFKTRRKYKNFSIFMLFVFSIPTSIVLLAASFSFKPSTTPSIFLSTEEFAAIRWIEENTPHESHFLAGPEIALLIPTYSHALVYYAHPFETIEANKKAQLLDDFYSGILLDPEEWLSQSEIDYIFYGLREKALGELPEALPIEEIYNSGDVYIFKVNHN